MRTIQYMIRENEATTQYRAIRDIDKKYIIDSLKTVQGLLQLMNKNNTNATIRMLFEQPSNTLPWQTRPARRRNSLSSFIDGVLENMDAGSQRDPSSKTCKGLVEVFKAMSELDVGFDEIQFEQVLDINKKNTPEMIEQSTFAKMFDIEAYKMTVTFEKK